MLQYTSGAVLHGSNIREALEAASAILVAEGYPPITIVSGDREYDEQVAIFLARYVLTSQVNGRRVYDFRWWEGRQYARISSAGTVAAPSPTAPHIARIAADLGYPYNVRSTAAHRRLQQIAPGLGLTWTGQYFGEDWHWETNRGVGRIDNGTPASNGGTTPTSPSGRLIVDANDKNIIDSMGQSVKDDVKKVVDQAGQSVKDDVIAAVKDLITAPPYTEQAYATFLRMLQRAVQYDIRPAGAGASWTLGPTIFELLRAADDSADVQGVQGAVSAIAVKMTAEDRAAIAKSVSEAIKIPAAGASKADVAAAIDAGLAKLVLKPAS